MYKICLTSFSDYMFEFECLDSRRWCFSPVHTVLEAISLLRSDLESHTLCLVHSVHLAAQRPLESQVFNLCGYLQCQL